MTAMAAFIIREGNIMDHMAEWQECNYLPDTDHSITSPEASRFLSSITLEQRIAFFRLWVKHHCGGKSVCYDVTSVSSLKYFSRYFCLTKHENDSGFDYEADTEKIENGGKQRFAEALS